MKVLFLGKYCKPSREKGDIREPRMLTVKAIDLG